MPTIRGYGDEYYSDEDDYYSDEDFDYDNAYDNYLDANYGR
jgi:hypothetical protein